MTTIQIAPSVALAEANALVEHYRHRSLIQAQAIADLQAELATLRAALPAPAEETPDA